MTWKPFLSLPNYLGGKRGLCPIIFREIGKVHPPRTWPNLTLLDPFMGGGSVSLYAKAQGLQVYANDLAYRCWVIGKGVIANNDQKLTDEDLRAMTEKGDGERGFVERNYVPHYFSPDQAQQVDRALAYTQTVEDETHQALIQAATIRFINMLNVGGQLSNKVLHTTLARGQFDLVRPAMLASSSTDRYFTPAVKVMRRVHQQVNGGIFWGRATISQDDAMAFMQSHPADIVYLDPPYFGSTAYEDNYHVLECILAGRLLPKPSHSPFNRQQTAWHSLCQMFEAAMHVPTWVFSFSDTSDGFSAKQLCELIADFGREPRVVPLQHRWSIATTVDHYEQGAQELLIIAR